MDSPHKGKTYVAYYMCNSMCVGLVTMPRPGIILSTGKIAENKQKKKGGRSLPSWILQFGTDSNMQKLIISQVSNKCFGESERRVRVFEVTWEGRGVSL